MGIADNGEVWLGFIGLGFLVIEPDGEHKVLRGSTFDNVMVTKISNKVVFAYQGYEMREPEKMHVRPLELLQYGNGEIIKLDQHVIKGLSNFSLEKGAWPLNSGGILTFVNGMYAVVEGNSIKDKFNSQIIAEKIIQTTDGKLLIASHLGPLAGLHCFSSLEIFKQGKGENLLPGKKVTDVYEDQEGGWWATTKGAGVMYCKNPAIDIYNVSSGLNTEDVMRLADDGQKIIFAGLKSTEIFKINLADGRIQTLATASSVFDVMALFYDTCHHKLWTSTPLAYYVSDIWTKVEALSPFVNNVNIINAKDISAVPAGDIAWMSSTYGFSSLDLATNHVIYARNADSTQLTSRTFAVTEDDTGIIWVATSDGLRVWEKDHFEPPPFDHEALKFPIRDIDRMADGSMAFGFLGGGVLIRDRSGHLTHFTTQEGMSTNMVFRLKAVGDGKLYACTNKGLNIIGRVDGSIWSIKTIDTRQGLPSNLVNDVTIVGGDLWIATDKGLVHLNQSPDAYPIPAPRLETFLVDHSRVNFSNGFELPYDQNNISIQFYSLHFRSEGSIVYRYRLDEEDTTFQVSSVRMVNFPELTPGSYTFEVQAQGEDGGWSESSQWSFTILPPWWQRWWFIAAMILLLVAIAVAIIRSRITFYREKARTEIKIKDLELAALRAQMNPHFIFNCLGSIQQFIIEHDSASATRYLARFAKLVRMSLHGSVDGKHSLAEEMEMLDNYLALEQMRFKGKFDYSITTSGEMDTEEIFLPPLLVQPFVENAVLHGVRNQSGQGVLNIEFTKHENLLRITITDNGPGFSPTLLKEDPAHKSVGMTLTNHRLDLLSGAADGRTYSQENITDLQGNVIGARVVIQIMVD